MDAFVSILLSLLLLCRLLPVIPLELPFGRRQRRHTVVNRNPITQTKIQNVRPARVSNEFCENSLDSSTGKNDLVKHSSRRRAVASAASVAAFSMNNHKDADNESLFDQHDNAINENEHAEMPPNTFSDDDIEILFQDDELSSIKNDLHSHHNGDSYSDLHSTAHFDDEDNVEKVPLDAMERAWRHCKKPLLRVGGKGIQFTHGNSLRQLLDAHQLVKVKVNTKRFGSLENAFTALKDLAVESGASPDIEMVQARECEKTILFGLPGMLTKIERDEFPPSPSVECDNDTSRSFPQP